MRKKISIKDLRVGMFVDGFNESWIKTPFLVHKFIIKDDLQIKKILEAGIKEVFVETSKGTIRQEVLKRSVDASDKEVRKVRAIITSASDDKKREAAQEFSQVGDKDDDSYVPAPVEMSKKESKEYAHKLDDLLHINKNAIVDPDETDFDMFVKRGVDIKSFKKYWEREGRREKSVSDIKGDLLIGRKDIARYKDYLKEAVKRGVEGSELQKLKNNIVRENTKIVVKELMDDPRSGESIKQCRGAVDEIIGSIQESGGLVSNLITLNKYDYYTYTHSVDVCVLAVGIAMAMGIDSERELNAIGIGSLLHDIGKSEIPPEILNKTSKLTDKEFEIMQGHVMKGYNIVCHHRHIHEKAFRPLLQHHERMTGDGYPNRLQAHEINTEGRIASIADTYDALTTERVYQRSHKPFEALVIIQKNSEKYDMEIFKYLVEMLGKHIGKEANKAQN